MSAHTLLKRAFFSAARYSGMNWVLRSTRGSRAFLTLCYHGVVTDDHPEELFLYRNTVSLRDFQFQLEFLTRHFHPISVSDLVRHLHTGAPLKPRAALVTFDDGYRNNWTHAAPLLLKYAVPAMFNVTTGYIGRAGVLWPDEVNLRVLDWPQSTIPCPSRENTLATLEVPQGAGDRVGLAEKIRAACKGLSEEARLDYLNVLRQVPCPMLDRRDRELFDFLSWDDVRSLTHAGFEIGSHTVTHPILTQIPAELLDYELKESKARIEAETGRHCTCLVYPNGQAPDFSATVVDAARRTGYLLGFSATGSYTSLDGDRYALSRIGVPGHQPPAVFESRTSGLHTWVKNIL
jgi:peptidoglycan/xylan/chitin deacetylase (PgdA/CDA1 family)